MGHIKNIHLPRCKHKTVKLILTLTLTQPIQEVLS